MFIVDARTLSYLPHESRAFGGDSTLFYVVFQNIPDVASRRSKEL